MTYEDLIGLELCACCRARRPRGMLTGGFCLPCIAMATRGEVSLGHRMNGQTIASRLALIASQFNREDLQQQLDNRRWC